ncbi:MAG: PadR family transcriptional regulator [Solirubrobacterales bacterium]
MALKHAILAALQDGEATGYELSKRFDVSVANFWPATPQQIYRELDRLESDGMLDSRLVEQSSRPNKRFFNVTAAGHTELEEFIRATARPTAIRDDLLVKVVALGQENTEEVAAAVNERLERTEAKLGLYAGLKSSLLGDLTEDEYLASDPRPGNYLALLAGINFEEGNRAWCLKTLKILEGRRSGIPG